MFTCNALAKCCAPSSSISFNPTSSDVSVCVKGKQATCGSIALESVFYASYENAMRESVLRKNGRRKEVYGFVEVWKIVMVVKSCLHDRIV